MQPELKKFLTRLLPYAFGGAVKKVFLRNKKPVEAKVLACYLYQHGPSYRQAKRLLEDLGLAEVAHSAIWYWDHRVGAGIGPLVGRRERRCLVVDETEVKTQSGQIYIFAAMDPENREMVHVEASKYRESIDALRFLKRCLGYCKGKPIVATDGGRWYLWPVQRLGLDHIVISGGERNRIERWFGTLKDRLRAFDCYFPTREPMRVQELCRAFAFFYNRCRPHMSLGGPPSGGGGGLKAWAEAFI